MLFFNLTVVIAHKRDWAVFALILPSLQESFGFRFGRKMSSQNPIFLSKTEARVSVCHGGRRRRKGKSPESLSGVEDLNGGNQGTALGGSRLSRRRTLALEPRRGTESLSSRHRRECARERATRNRTGTHKGCPKYDVSLGLEWCLAAGSIGASKGLL